MRKYILGIAAMIMVVAASAFTIINKSNPAKAEATLWFLMDPSGTSITTTQVTDPASLCPFKDEPNCARQYNESQTEIVNGVTQVKPSEVDSQIDFRSKE